MITKFRPNDIFAIEDIHEESCTFPMPDFNSPVTIISKTIIHDGKIVGASWVHLTAEIGLILDKSLPLIAKAKLIKEVFVSLLEELEQTDLEDCHAYTVPETDVNWAKFLTTQFDFELDKGTSLCRSIKNEQSKRECSERFSQQLEDASADSDGAD